MGKPRSASVVTQYESLLICAVGLHICELKLQGDRAVIEAAALTEYNKLFKYDEMAKKFPEFASRVKSADWKVRIICYCIPKVCVRSCL